jgi:hypothetical protein
MDYRDSILDGWAAVIVRNGWAGARVDAVARETGLPIGAVVDDVADRWDALRGLQARFDRAALVESASDPDDSIRNRLFAVIMARFDAAQAQRALVEVIAAAVQRDPGLAAFVATRVPVSVRRLAEAAGVDAGGLLGPLRIAVLAALQARVARIWLADATADLAPTMKALDSALAQAEQLAKLVPGRAKVPLEAPQSAGDHRAE